MKISISIIGSTGSVGRSTLEIVDKKRKLFNIDILSANKNYKLITSQIKKYRPKLFIISDFKIFNHVYKKFKNSKTKIINNYSAIKLKKKTDITVSAIPGIIGLAPTLKMIKISKKVLIANKESVICGWSLISKVSKKIKLKLFQ